MAIDRVTPSGAALNIPDRVAREQPGQAQPIPPVQQPAQDGPQFALGAGVQAAAGPLPDTMEEKPAVPALPAALAGKMALLDDALSMQPNQVFLSRQLVWHPPEPSAIAASWMAMVRTYAEQRAAQMQQSRGRHVPASLFQSDQAPAVFRDGRVPPRLVSEADAWRFAVYAWGTEKLVLRVVTRDEDDAPTARRRRARVALRLEVHLSGLGKVVVQIEPADDGAVLEIGAAQERAMRHMRAMLPQLGEIAVRCGAGIARVRLMREVGAPGTREPGHGHIVQLTQPLFKTMTEIAVLLSQPLPAPALATGPAI